MNRNAGMWFLGAFVVLGLAVLGFVLGLNLVPSRAVAQGKGTIVPWYLVWGMIWITSLTGVVLASFLVKTGMDEGRESHPVSASRRTAS